MAEAIQKKLELILTARDEATKVVDETVKRTKQKLREVGGEGGDRPQKLEDLLGLGGAGGLKTVGAIAAAKIGVEGLVGALTEYHRAVAEGRDTTAGALHGFVAAIPIVNNIQSKIDELKKAAYDARFAIQDALVADANRVIAERVKSRQTFWTDYLAESDRQFDQQRMFGKTGVHAEIEQITAKSEADIAKLEALRQRVTDLPESERKGRYESIDQKILDAETRRDSAIAEARKKHQQSLEQESQDHERRLAEIRAEGHEKELRALGLDLEADIDAIRRAADKEVDAIREAAEKAKDAVPLTGTGQGSLEVAGRYYEIDKRAREEQDAVRRRQQQEEDSRRMQEALNGKGFSDLFPSLGAITGFLGGIGSKPSAPGPARNADLIDSRFLTGIAMATREGRANGPEEKTAENTGKTATGVADMARDISNLLSEVRAKAGGLLPF